MCNCKFGRLEKNEIVKYSCSQVKRLSEKWKKEFRDKNFTDKLNERGIIDKQYEEFCGQINSFLKNCTCNDFKFCEKCPPEDHEGIFCRCESRNIALAKDIRSKL